MKKKYYLVDIGMFKGDYSNLSNEEFKEVSKQQDLVFTQEEFVSSFYYGVRVDSYKHHLRIL